MNSSQSPSIEIRPPVHSSAKLRWRSTAIIGGSFSSRTILYMFLVRSPAGDRTRKGFYGGGRVPTPRGYPASPPHPTNSTVSKRICYQVSYPTAFSRSAYHTILCTTHYI